MAVYVVNVYKDSPSGGKINSRENFPFKILTSNQAQKIAPNARSALTRCTVSKK